MPTQILPATVFEVNPEFPHVCRDCGEPMNGFLQPSLTGKAPMTLITCWVPGCSLNGVTLTPTQYNALTEAQLQSYREMVSNRAVMAVQE